MPMLQPVLSGGAEEACMSPIPELAMPPGATIKARVLSSCFVHLGVVELVQAVLGKIQQLLGCDRFLLHSATNLSKALCCSRGQQSPRWWW